MSHIQLGNTLRDISEQGSQFAPLMLCLSIEELVSIIQYKGYKGRALGSSNIKGELRGFSFIILLLFKNILWKSKESKMEEKEKFLQFHVE